jgi:hypothetical protein
VSHELHVLDSKDTFIKVDDQAVSLQALEELVKIIHISDIRRAEHNV